MVVRKLISRYSFALKDFPFLYEKGRILFRTVSFCFNFFNKIVGVASSPKARFEVSDIAIE